MITFSANSKKMSAAINRIKGAASSTTVLASLSCILFEVSKGSLKMTSSDLQTTISISLDVISTKGVGMICVPAKQLAAHLKNVGDIDIDFTIDIDGNKISMSGETGDYSLGCEKAGNFPKTAENTNKDKMTLDWKLFSDPIARALYAVSSDTLRPAMTGICIETDKAGVTFAATNAHVLSVYSRKDLGKLIPSMVVIPKRCLQLAIAALGKIESVTYSVNGVMVFINADDIQLVMRVIDARFPDYKAIIPIEKAGTAIINRFSLMKTLNRLIVFSNSSTRQGLCEISKGSLKITSSDIDYSSEGKESIGISYNGADFKIAFNMNLLMQTVKHLHGENITMDFQSPTRCVIIKQSEPSNGVEGLNLIMPLQTGV